MLEKSTKTKTEGRGTGNGRGIGIGREYSDAEPSGPGGGLDDMWPKPMTEDTEV